MKISTATPAQPYAPSAIDRFNRRVGKLPLPAWAFFLALGAGLVFVQLAFLWLEGGAPDGALLPVVVFNGLFVAFLLALIYLLDRQAAAALGDMRPVLDMGESERARQAYTLAHMPSRAPLLAGLAMVVLVILMERLAPAPARYAGLAELPLSTIVFQLVDKGSAFLFGVFIYHTVRQLRLVTRVLGHVRVNLFNLGPVQALSRLTATTAIGLTLGVYGWIAINPELLADPLILGFVAIITLLAAAVFAMPLLGVHRRMVAEKEAALRALDGDLETVFAQFNRAFRDDDYDTVERLNGTIASLEIQSKRVAAVPTWPWKPETAQFVFAAIALPLVLAVIQLLLEQALQ